MTQPQRQLLPLWDYGWFDYNEIKLSPCEQSRELIYAYLNSIAFETSFVGPELEHAPNLHGPFWQDLIVAEDFQVIDAETFYSQVRSIRCDMGFDEPPDEEQWSAVENLMSNLESQYQWVIMLRLTEKDADKFHDWGDVLCLFREFILANPNSEDVARLIFGYD